MARSRAPRRPLWLIANHDNGRLDVLTLDPGSETEALPIFSFEEEAEAFLRLGTPQAAPLGAGTLGAAWRARKTTPGELTSLLHGPCAGVKRVALDPLPVVDGAAFFDLLGPGREAFLQTFVGDPRFPLGKPWVVATVPELLENGNGGKREWLQNGSARREPASVRDGSRDGADKSSIFDKTLDFYPSNGLRDNPSGRHRIFRVSEGVGEDLARNRE